MRTKARRGAHALTMAVLTAAVSLSGAWRPSSPGSSRWRRSGVNGCRATGKTRPTRSTSSSISAITPPAGGRSRPGGDARATRLRTGRNPCRNSRSAPDGRGPRVRRRGSYRSGCGRIMPRRRPSVLAPRLRMSIPFDPDAGPPDANPLPRPNTPRRPSQPAAGCDAVRSMTSTDPGASLSPVRDPVAAAERRDGRRRTRADSPIRPARAGLGLPLESRRWGRLPHRERRRRAPARPGGRGPRTLG